jgi:hypothetical protein
VLVNRPRRCVTPRWPLAGFLALVVSLTWTSVSLAADPQPKLSLPKPPISVAANEPIDLDFQATNSGADASNGSLTISIQGAASVDIVDRSRVPNNDSSYAKVLPIGSIIFNRTTGSTMTSRLQTAELFASPWPANTTHHMTLHLVASSGVTLFARATLRSASGGFISDPASGPSDQQGFSAAQVSIPLTQPATPTAAPKPTSPPTAPPTSVPTAVVVVAPTLAPPTLAAPTRPPASTAPPVPTPTPIVNDPPVRTPGLDLAWLLALPAVLLAGGGLYVLGRRSAHGPGHAASVRPIETFNPDDKVVTRPVDIDEYGEIREKT